MEAHKLGDVCPACGLPRKVFETYRVRVSPNRLEGVGIYGNMVCPHTGKEMYYSQYAMCENEAENGERGEIYNG